MRLRYRRAGLRLGWLGFLIAGLFSLVSILTQLAYGAAVPNVPTITFVSPSPAEGASLTTSSISFKFTYNRTPKATQTLTCALSGPTSSSSPCDAPIAFGSKGSQSGKSYSGLATGSYTFTVSLTLTDGGTASATRHLGVAVTASAITAGRAHTCALMSTGGAKCWGSNGQGESGNGATLKSSSPLDVIGLSSGVAGIFSGGDAARTCAVTRAGAAKCWGDNDFGALGNGSTTESSVPVDVIGLSSGVSALAVGGHHTCGLTTAGAVKCWGSNSDGALGDGSTTDSSTPVDVSGLSSGVSAITAGGEFFTCALTSAGGVKCWGEGGFGNLGNGSTARSLTPTDVSGLSSGVVAIAAGDAHVCALTSAGGVKCWGDNLHGELGNGSTANALTPVDVSGLSSGVAAIAAGGLHTCALTNAGAVKCWGENDRGQLGNGTDTGSTGAATPTPVDVIGLSSGVSAIAAGLKHDCALMSMGAIKCWGDDAFGELGNGIITATPIPTPVDVVF